MGLLKEKAAIESSGQLSLEREKSGLQEKREINVLREKARLFPSQPRGLSGEAAGRLSLSSMGETSARTAKQLLFETDRNGQLNLNRGLIRAMHSPFGAGMVFSPESQRLEFHLKRALDAQLRAETGAALNPAELTRMTQEFISNSLADPQAAYEKLETLEQGLRMTRHAIDPTGRFALNPVSPFEPQNEEDLSGMADEELLEALRTSQ